MKIKEFIHSIRGLSDNTKKAYEQSLFQLHDHIAGDEPTDDEVRKFLSSYSTSSMHRHKAAIKTYFEFMQRPWMFGRREFPVERRRIPRYQPPEVIQQIIDLAENKHDRMFVDTLFQLGCRISELMNITAEGVFPEGVRLRTKGGHHKLKPITKEFHARLTEYIGKRKGRIFAKPYSYYNKTLKDLGKKAGIDDISCHMLRHSRAVDLLRKNMPLAFVQQFLGHANINTTAIYLEITGGELANELEKAERNGNGNRSALEVPA